MGFDEQEYTRSFDIRSWKKLLPFLRPYRGLVAVVLVLNVFCAVIDIALPLFQRYAIDEFIETGDVAGLPGFALFYGCVIGLQALAVILFTRRSMRIEMQLGRDMKRACFVHLQTLSLSYYNVTPVGYLLSRIMSDTNRIAGMIAAEEALKWAAGIRTLASSLLVLDTLSWEMQRITLAKMPDCACCSCRAKHATNEAVPNKA